MELCGLFLNSTTIYAGEKKNRVNYLRYLHHSAEQSLQKHVFKKWHY